MEIRVLGPIGHCSARLRMLLQIEEDKALRWNVKARRDQDQEKKSSGRRWTVTPNFGVPGPFSSRPISPLGYVSFHFSQVTVSKGAGGKSLLASGSREKELGASAAADHDRYATREDAVLTVSAADFEQYAGRPSAVELSDGLTVAILSNISDDPAERREFWLKVHEHEREAKPDRLVFHRDRLSVAGWRTLAAAAALPQEVRDVAARMVNTALSASRAKGDASLEIDRSEAHKLRQTIREVVGAQNSKREPVRVSKGRSGRTQYRLTAEFPAGLDAVARLIILRQFCQLLEELGVMYTAAIHAPDAHNDERNDHLHIVYYDRPCRKMSDGRWDFEVAEKVEGQHNRFRYPYRQPKIAELSRCPDGTNSRAYRASVIYSMREHFAELCNEELTKIGSTRLFDPRRYSEMGIDQTPTQPLGPKAAPLEAAGIPTRRGVENAEILWTYRLEQVRQHCEKRQQDRSQLLLELDEVVREVDRSGDADEASRLRSTLAEAKAHTAVLDAHELEMEEFAVTLEMAYSRPDKVVETCARILESLEQGKGSRTDRKDQFLIAGRQAAAEAFISEVDAIRDQSLAAMEPFLKEVESARAELEKLAVDLPQLRERASQRTRDVPARTASGADDLVPSTRPHDLIDAVLRRVTDLHLVREPTAGQPLYTVPGISREDYRVLSVKDYTPWIQSRLGAIAAIQTRRAKEAAVLCRQFGLEGLAARASESPQAQRALRHIAAYRDHPAIRELHDEGSKRPAELVTTRVVSAQHSGAAGCADKPVTATVAEGWLDISQEVAAAQSRWTPSISMASSAPDEPDASRQQAIAAYSEFVTTWPEIVIEEVSGIMRVNPDSVCGCLDGEDFDWRRSAEAFENEEAVKAAIQDRVASDLQRARDAELAAEAAAQERAKQRTLDRIIRELPRCGRRPVSRRNGRWEVTGLSSDLNVSAIAWQDDPELAELYERTDLVWNYRERVEEKTLMAKADFLYPSERLNSGQARHPSGHDQEPNPAVWKAFKEPGGQGV